MELDGDMTEPMESDDHMEWDYVTEPVKWHCGEFKKTVDAKESRCSRQEMMLQIRKMKKEARMAKHRQMPMKGISAPTLAGLAAANMLINA